MSSAPRKRLLLDRDDDDDSMDGNNEYDEESQKGKQRLRILTFILVPLLMIRVSRKLFGRGLMVSLLLVVGPLYRKVYRLVHLEIATHQVISPLIGMHRDCPTPMYETISSTNANKICMTTLTDEKHRSWMQQLYGWRNYQGVLATTWPNKLGYAQKHGYQLWDESDRVDPNRPPAWSKPLAVQRLFREEECDWVVWMDADTVIMNSEQRLEHVLPEHYDLVITGDLHEPRKNNGVWMLRNSDWSRRFLDEWYNMTDFIAPVGYAYSGDQAAMNELMQQYPAKIVSPPQCTFNSFVHLRDDRVPLNLTAVQDSEYYYHEGDFVAHAAGCDLKLAVLREFVQLAK